MVDTEGTLTALTLTI